MDRPSPEEKLLRLIKDATGKGARQKKKQADAQESVQPSSPELPVRTQKLRTHQKRIKKLKTPIFSFKFINKVLHTLLVIIFLFFVFNIIYSSREISQVEREGFEKDKDLEFASFPETLEGEFTDYLSAGRRRDIFTSSGMQMISEGLASSIFDAEQYVGKLKLLGIISGIKSQAIVEDQNENKNYTLSVGDYLKEFLVEEVGKGKVLFDYKGEKFDLYL
ncbi:MAG: hypothetical protein KJ593_00930 [Candidatus Omnitrophica bacterium]|nr:hypothetical protein [Candidatus Omnitrophota bacterium]